jgi:hypothetical protein
MQHLFQTYVLKCFRSDDGAQLFHQPHIHLCFERVVLLSRNMFKFLGCAIFLEIWAASKKSVLFHDNDLVLLRFSRGLNHASTDSSQRDVLADWKDGRTPWLGGLLHPLSDVFHWFFLFRSFGDEF